MATTNGAILNRRIKVITNFEDTFQLLAMAILAEDNDDDFIKDLTAKVSEVFYSDSSTMTTKEQNDQDAQLTEFLINRYKTMTEEHFALHKRNVMIVLGFGTAFRDCIELFEHFKALGVFSNKRVLND